jgi:hypothetical protein
MGLSNIHNNNKKNNIKRISKNSMKMINKNNKPINQIS